MEQDNESAIQRVPSHSSAVSAVLEPSTGLKLPEPGSTYLDMDTLKPVSQNPANLLQSPELLHSSSNGTVYFPQVRTQSLGPFFQ